MLPWIAKLMQTSATLDCKTHQNAVDYAQRDPALQKPFLSLFPVPSVGKILVIPISALTSWSLMVFTLLSSSLERTEKIRAPVDVPNNKTSQAQAGTCEEDDHLLDIGLLSGIPQLF